MPNSQTAQIDDASVRNLALQRWFVQPPGSLLAEAEQAALKKSLPNLFGYHILQLGDPISADLLSSSRIAHRIVTSVASDRVAVSLDHQPSLALREIDAR